MTIIYFKQRSALPSALLLLRSIVISSTMTFAAWFMLASYGIVPIYPNALLLSPTPTWHWLWQPITAATTIPYPSLDFSLLFDLLMINFFLTPIVTFVVSFLTDREFLKFLALLMGAGAASFGLASTFLDQGAPCSLFSGLALSMVIFWLLLHRKGQASLFLAFPISKRWALAITAIATLYVPIRDHEWARLIAILTMGVSAYLWGITRWRLRSYIPALEKMESWIEAIYRKISFF